MIKRWIKDNLTEQLANRRGVNLAGARQVGKSTLSQMLDLKAARRCVKHGFGEIELLGVADLPEAPAITGFATCVCLRR